MPNNAVEILDKCVANLPMFRGLFVLFKDKTDAVRLLFVGLNPSKQNPVLKSIAQPVPAGARLLASFDNKDGFTDLLIAGRTLTWRSAQDCEDGSRKEPETLCSDDNISGAIQLHVAQSKNILSTWALNEGSLLSYQEFVIAQEDSDNVPAQRTSLLPLLQGTVRSKRFSAIQSPKLGQKLFVIDDAGAMRMLEQNVETAIWQAPVDVMIPDSNEMIEFSSYTTRVQVDDQSGAPLINQTFKLYSSTSAEMLVNGASIRGSPSGQLLNTDDTGTLTIIIRAEGLSAPILTLDDADPKGKVFQGKPLTIDPMSKLWSTVGDIKSAKDLKDMQLPDGTGFVRPGMSDKDLESAAKALQDLSKVKNELASPSKPSVSAVTKDRDWGFMYYLYEKAEDAYNWVVEKVKEGWQLVVEFAGKAWKFLLENVPQVAAAMQKIFEAVSSGWEWVKKKLGFIFAWGDIVDVKNIFVNLTTQGILWGADSISLLELKTQDFFDDLRERFVS